MAVLQTLIQRNVAADATVLASHVTAGIPAVGVRLGETTAALTAGGMDSMDASRGALGLVGKAVIGQSTVIAFDTAFNAVALLFIAAAPALIIIRVALARLVKGRA